MPRLSCLVALAAFACAAGPAVAETSGGSWITEVRSGAAATPPVVASQRPRETGSLGRTKPRPHAVDGIASYYWQGHMTASGEAFDKRAMTAAHPTLPFRTMVEVTNLGNGRTARVRINDRGPFKPGRVIDVSEAAADVLGMRARGLASVRLEIVSAAGAR